MKTIILGPTDNTPLGEVTFAAFGEVAPAVASLVTVDVPAQKESQRPLTLSSFDIRALQQEAEAHLTAVSVLGQTDRLDDLQMKAGQLLEVGKPEAAFNTCTYLLRTGAAGATPERLAICFVQTIELSELSQSRRAPQLSGKMVGLLGSMMERTEIDSPPHQAAVSSMITQMGRLYVSGKDITEGAKHLAFHTTTNSPESQLGLGILAAQPGQVDSVVKSFTLQAMRAAYEVRVGIRQGLAPV